ncbi:hypothetical protein S40293_06431 [Stachybotrys chartarum IBT 40293]|nr:hypothetical protein S40293_06431 [Stachybotrys chartarum IBT 40293]
MADQTQQGPDPPHPVLDSAAFPKAWAHDQPHASQTTFSRFYPNGLPIVYNMVQDHQSPEVVQKYIENNLPAVFYTQPPANAKAAFSTSEGQRPFRAIGDVLTARHVHLWSKDEIQSVCNSIRQVFCHLMKGMPKPFCWDNLWIYFDAHDLYHYGALNLWNVINHLYDENQIIYTDIMKEAAVWVGQWADNWQANDANESKLRLLNDAASPMVQVLTPADWESMGNIDDNVLPMISSALRARRGRILGDGDQHSSDGPTDLLSACYSNDLQNWLVGEPKFHPSGLPPAPSAELQPTRTPLKHLPTPCHVHQGNHYFLPSNPPSTRVISGHAVQQLQASADAAMTSTKGSDSSSSIAPIADADQPASPPAWKPQSSTGTEEPYPFKTLIEELAASASPMKGRKPRAASMPTPHLDLSQWHEESDGQGTPMVTVSAPASAIIDKVAPLKNDQASTDENDSSPSRTLTNSPSVDKSCGQSTCSGNTVLVESKPLPSSTGAIALYQPPHISVPPFEAQQGALRFPMASQTIPQVASIPTAQTTPIGTGDYSESVMSGLSVGMMPPHQLVGASSFAGSASNRPPHLGSKDIAPPLVFYNNTHYSSVHTLPASLNSNVDNRLYSENHENLHNFGNGVSSKSHQPHVSSSENGRMDHSRGGYRKGGRNGRYGFNKDTGGTVQRASFQSHSNGRGGHQQNANRHRQSFSAQQESVRALSGIVCPNRQAKTGYIPYGYPETELLRKIADGLEKRYGQVEAIDPAGYGSLVVRFSQESYAVGAMEAHQGIMPEHQIAVAIEPAHRSKWSQRTLNRSTRSLDEPLLSPSTPGISPSVVSSSYQPGQYTHIQQHQAVHVPPLFNHAANHSVFAATPAPGNPLFSPQGHQYPDNLSAQRDVAIHAQAAEDHAQSQPTYGPYAASNPVQTSLGQAQAETKDDEVSKERTQPAISEDPVVSDALKSHSTEMGQSTASAKETAKGPEQKNIPTKQMRSCSKFTDKEIEGRKQAWNRISMPQSTRKCKTTTRTDGGNSLTVPQGQGSSADTSTRPDEQDSLRSVLLSGPGTGTTMALTAILNKKKHDNGTKNEVSELSTQEAVSVMADEPHSLPAHGKAKSQQEMPDESTTTNTSTHDNASGASKSTGPPVQIARSEKSKQTRAGNTKVEACAVSEHGHSVAAGRITPLPHAQTPASTEAADSPNQESTGKASSVSGQQSFGSVKGKKSKKKKSQRPEQATKEIVDGPGKLSTKSSALMTTEEALAAPVLDDGSTNNTAGKTAEKYVSLKMDTSPDDIQKPASLEKTEAQNAAAPDAAQTSGMTQAGTQWSGTQQVRNYENKNQKGGKGSLRVPKRRKQQPQSVFNIDYTPPVSGNLTVSAGAATQQQSSPSRASSPSKNVSHSGTPSPEKGTKDLDPLAKIFEIPAAAAAVPSRAQGDEGNTTADRPSEDTVQPLETVKESKAVDKESAKPSRKGRGKTASSALNQEGSERPDRKPSKRTKNSSHDKGQSFTEVTAPAEAKQEEKAPLNETDWPSLSASRQRAATATTATASSLWAARTRAESKASEPAMMTSPGNKASGNKFSN